MGSRNCTNALSAQGNNDVYVSLGSLTVLFLSISKQLFDQNYHIIGSQSAKNKIGKYALLRQIRANCHTSVPEEITFVRSMIGWIRGNSVLRQKRQAALRSPSQNRRTGVCDKILILANLQSFNVSF